MKGAKAVKATRLPFTIQYTFLLVLVLFLCTPASALTPEVYSIEPNHGSSASPTVVTIHGNNFEQTPKVALYGGGPWAIGSVDTPGFASAVYVSGNYAYVADRSAGLQVIDSSNPATPTIVGSVETPGTAYDVHVSGNYAYVVDGYAGLQVIDVSNPANPTIIGSVETPGYADGIYVAGNHVYVADSKSVRVLSTYVPFPNIVFVDSTTLTAEVPVGMPEGTYNLHVINPDGERTILHNCFTVQPGLPPGRNGKAMPWIPLLLFED